MKTSARGIDLIKQFEGLELEAYQDIAGVWTIGYGHTGDVEPGMRITEREAEKLLRDDLIPRERAVGDLTSVDINQNEFDALVSFVYNVGVSAYAGSTARARLNRNDRVGAADALTWWNKATINGVLTEVAGLTRRRAAERALFLTPVNPPIVNQPTAVNENSRVTPVEDPPRRDNIAQSRTVQGATVAGGAGVAASTMGRDNAEELDQLESNIESGAGVTEDESAGEGSIPPGGLDDPVPDGCVRDTLVDGEIDFANDPAVEMNGKSCGPNGGVVAETEDGVVPDGESDMETGEVVVDSSAMDRPSKHEVHAVEAQVQFALLILIVLAVLYIIIARIDDWRNYRR